MSYSTEIKIQTNFITLTFTLMYGKNFISDGIAGRHIELNTTEKFYIKHNQSNEFTLWLSELKAGYGVNSMINTLLLDRLYNKEQMTVSVTVFN